MGMCAYTVYGVPVRTFDEWRSVSAYYVRQTDRGRVRRNVWPGGFFV